MLQKINRNLWSCATQSLRQRVTLASNLMEAIEKIKEGSAIIEAFWCGDEKCRHWFLGEWEAEEEGEMSDLW